MKRPPFRLERRTAPPRAARHVALAQLDYALAGLGRADARAIHEARKACKRLRALLRLLRPALGAAYRLENRAVRDTGRALAQHRDAAVLLQTARALAARDPALRPLARLLHARPRPVTVAALRDAQRRLRAERERVACWPIEDLSVGALLAGLLAGYDRAWRSHRRARRSGSARALHEWRKQVKYHSYQSELLAPLWPELRRRARRLDRLGDLLGHHHDLEVLAQTLGHGAAAAGEPLRQRAQRAIGRKQARTAATALALGRRLFDEKPLAWLSTHTP